MLLETLLPQIRFKPKKNSPPTPTPFLFSEFTLHFTKTFIFVNAIFWAPPHNTCFQMTFCAAPGVPLLWAGIGLIFEDSSHIAAPYRCTPWASQLRRATMLWQGSIGVAGSNLHVRAFRPCKGWKRYGAAYKK